MAYGSADASAAARLVISQGTELPTSSLIICSRNRPRLLEETVESVLAGDELPSELLIVDQSDERHPSLDKLESRGMCQIRYIWSRSIGVCRARNEGIRAARYDLLVLIDDDMQVPPNWYGSLVRALVRGGPRCVVTGRVLPGKTDKGDGFVPALVTGTEPHTYAGRSAADPLVSCHMAMYRSVFKEVGGFDERLGPGTRFRAAEDNDYGFRLLESDYQIVYVPAAVIYHRAWRGRKDYLPMRWNYGRGKGAFFTKYASVRDPYMLRRMLRDILLRVIRFPWRSLHRPLLAIGDLAYVGGVLSGAAEWVLTGQGKLSTPSILERTANK